MDAETPDDAQPIERILIPFQRFLHAQTTGGVILMATTLVALVWANSPWADSYHKLWHTDLSIGLGSLSMSHDLHWWINDALMAAFFFLVGLEIKRELMVGELASVTKASLPIAGAIGGMVVPALIYTVFNFSSDGARGWGIPMATDIAFALGVLALVRSAIPVSAKVFLTALAIVDDIGASLVIAVFYTEEIWWASLIVGVGLFIVMLAMNRSGVRNSIAYFIVGLGLWLAFLRSGVHPTLSGILGAMAIPSRVRIDGTRFLHEASQLLDRFRAAGKVTDNVLTNPEQRGTLAALDVVVNRAETPLQQLERAMHPWVSFVIMPLFALANAGVGLNVDFVAAATHPVTIGVAAGLVLGKQIGIFGFAWVAVMLGISKRPADLSWSCLYGIAWLGGIGFTMSLFVCGLALTDETLVANAKLGILVASLFSGLAGWIILSKTTGSPPKN